MDKVVVFAYQIPDAAVKELLLALAAELKQNIFIKDDGLPYLSPQGDGG